jgi:hypothetical protein
MVRGGGWGLRRWYHTSPKQGGARGSTTGSTQGHESGQKKPTKGLVITLLHTPKCCSKKPNKSLLNLIEKKGEGGLWNSGPQTDKHAPAEVTLQLQVNLFR